MSSGAYGDDRSRRSVTFMGGAAQPGGSELGANGAAAGAPFLVGQEVEGEKFKASWYQATITQADHAKGPFKLNFVGFGVGWDEWMPATRIRNRAGAGAQPEKPYGSNPADALQQLRASVPNARPGQGDELLAATMASDPSYAGGGRGQQATAARDEGRPRGKTTVPGLISRVNAANSEARDELSQSSRQYGQRAAPQEPSHVEQWVQEHAAGPRLGTLSPASANDSSLNPSFVPATFGDTPPSRGSSPAPGAAPQDSSSVLDPTAGRGSPRRIREIRCTFPHPGPIGVFFATNANDTQVSIQSIQADLPGGRMHQLMPGLVLQKVNGVSVTGKRFADAMDTIRRAGRPLVLVFVPPVDLFSASGTYSKQRVAESASAAEDATLSEAPYAQAAPSTPPPAAASLDAAVAAATAPAEERTPEAISRPKANRVVAPSQRPSEISGVVQPTSHAKAANDWHDHQKEYYVEIFKRLSALEQLYDSERGRREDLEVALGDAESKVSDLSESLEAERSQRVLTNNDVATTKKLVDTMVDKIGAVMTETAVQQIVDSNFSKLKDGLAQVDGFLKNLHEQMEELGPAVEEAMDDIEDLKQTREVVNGKVKKIEMDSEASQISMAEELANIIEETDLNHEALSTKMTKSVEELLASLTEHKQRAKDYAVEIDKTFEELEEVQNGLETKAEEHDRRMMLAETDLDTQIGELEDRIDDSVGDVVKKINCANDKVLKFVGTIDSRIDNEVENVYEKIKTSIKSVQANVNECNETVNATKTVLSADLDQLKASVGTQMAALAQDAQGFAVKVNMDKQVVQVAVNQLSEKLSASTSQLGKQLADAQEDVTKRTLELKNQAHETEINLTLAFKDLADAQAATETQYAIACLKEAFDSIDGDNSGSLDAAEIGRIFALHEINIEADKLHELVEHIDKDKSGDIDFDEFSTWMKSDHKTAEDLRHRLGQTSVGLMHIQSANTAEKAQESRDVLQGLIEEMNRNLVTEINRNKETCSAENVATRTELTSTLGADISKCSETCAQAVKALTADVAATFEACTKQTVTEVTSLKTQLIQDVAKCKKDREEGDRQLDEKHSSEAVKLDNKVSDLSVAHAFTAEALAASIADSASKINGRLSETETRLDTGARDMSRRLDESDSQNSKNLHSLEEKFSTKNSQITAKVLEHQEASNKQFANVAVNMEENVMSFKTQIETTRTQINQTLKTKETALKQQMEQSGRTLEGRLASSANELKRADSELRTHTDAQNKECNANIEISCAQLKNGMERDVSALRGETAEATRATDQLLETECLKLTESVSRLGTQTSADIAECKANAERECTRVDTECETKITQVRVEAAQLKARAEDIAAQGAQAVANCEVELSTRIADASSNLESTISELGKRQQASASRFSKELADCVSETSQLKMSVADDADKLEEALRATISSQGVDFSAKQAELFATAAAQGKQLRTVESSIATVDKELRSALDAKVSALDTRQRAALESAVSKVDSGLRAAVEQVRTGASDDVCALRADHAGRIVTCGNLIGDECERIETASTAAHTQLQSATETAHAQLQSQVQAQTESLSESVKASAATTQAAIALLTERLDEYKTAGAAARARIDLVQTTEADNHRQVTASVAALDDKCTEVKAQVDKVDGQLVSLKTEVKNDMGEKLKTLGTQMEEVKKDVEEKLTVQVGELKTHITKVESDVKDTVKKKLDAVAKTVNRTERELSKKFADGENKHTKLEGLCDVHRKTVDTLYKTLNTELTGALKSINDDVVALHTEVNENAVNKQMMEFMGVAAGV